MGANKMTTQDKLTLLGLITEFDTLHALADEGKVTIGQHKAYGDILRRDINRILQRQCGRRKFANHGPVIEATLLTQEIGNQ
jgi:hypothetical protein